MNKEEKNSTKCPICERQPYKESKFCIFHASAEEKTEEEFKNALIEYVDKIEEKDGDYDFEKFIFVGNIYFKIYLNITVFKNAFFSGATFKGEANFSNVTFEGGTYFSGATFERKADFALATFEGIAFFSGATFERKADFAWVTFKGGTYFSGATFEVGANFKGAIFKGEANFELINLINVIILSWIKVFPGMTCLVSINNGRGKIYFKRAYLENTYLNIELVEGVSIDFTDTLLKNTKIQKDKIENHILQEKEKKFSEAKEIFLLLKNNFHSIGRYDDESWAFKKEKDMERLSHSYPFYMKELKRKDKKEKFPILKWVKKGDLKKWIISSLSNIIYGYGEKPWNVIFSALAIIIIFALLFSVTGIGNPKIIELQGKIHPIPGTDMRLVSKGVLQNTKIMRFSSSLYFSLITFTTLGYGDFRPLEGWGRILAGSEAFIGAFMMALFVYTFARRTGGG